MASPPPSGTAGLALALDFEGTALSGGALLRSLNPNGVSGRIASPGETRSYAFTLTARTMALFDSLTPNSSLTWTLTRSEEHTSELQSLMRHSYAVFCLKKKKEHNKR